MTDIHPAHVTSPPSQRASIVAAIEATGSHEVADAIRKRVWEWQQRP